MELLIEHVNGTNSAEYHIKRWITNDEIAQEGIRLNELKFLLPQYF